jgi:tetratricopeptide (TPR) repeat protein
MVVFGALAAYGQGLHLRMSGRIEGIKGDLSMLYVELRDAAGHALVERSQVGVDGTFGFDVPSGSYDVRVVTGVHEEVIAQDYVQINALGGQLVLRVPQDAKPKPVSGVVSVKELQAPVPKKAWQAFVKAQQYAEADQAGLAIEQYQRAIALDPAWRDAHSNLGAQLMRAGRTEDALGEFREALRIGPASAMLYTNLATALATERRTEEAESAVRTALGLDGSDAKARYLLGHVLVMQPGREKEALAELRAASAQVPAARIVAANVLLRTGEKADARAELHAYLDSGDRGHRQVAEELLQRMGK